MTQDFLAFVVRHWELWLAFIVVFGYWLVLELQEHHRGNALSTHKAVHMMNRENAVIIDLRDNEAYRQGHILGALSLPEKNLFEQLNKIKKYQQKPLILVDATGQSAPAVMKKLLKEGYSQVSHLKGGMQAWSQAKLPQEKSN